jgi:peptidyl-prolyl cis-trans isomerase A (cyclophilin A)
LGSRAHWTLQENAKRAATIPDEPVVASNKQHFVSYAKAEAPNSRTTQLFMNYGDNPQLDGQGFPPVGVVTSGTEYLSRVYDPTPGDPSRPTSA